MNSNYIINRLKTTPFKFPTVDIMRTRLRNLEADKRNEIVNSLKIEVWRARNADIHEPLIELLYKTPFAS